MSTKSKAKTVSKEVSPIVSSPLVDALLPLFSAFQLPRLRLPLPSFRLPSAMTVFSLLFLSYFLVFSGIIYDIVIEPPSIGGVKDEATGATKPVAFMAGRINGQYITEGLSAGFLFCTGGVGFILLDRATKATSNQTKYLFAIGATLLIMISYLLCIVFIRIKVPGY